MTEEQPRVVNLIDAEPSYVEEYGAAYCGDSKTLIDKLDDESIDLVVTSPPFALQHEKEYGNKPLEEYNGWFQGFAKKLYPKLKPHGSFVIEIGGAFQPGHPERSTYQFDLLPSLTAPDLTDGEGQYHLAQDFYWYNPAKLPSPIEWVNVRRIRVTDAVTHIWWLSKEINGDSAIDPGESPHPEADNRRVLQEYSDSQKNLLETGEYNDGERPSGWNINAESFANKNDGAIPDTLLENEPASLEAALENVSVEDFLAALADEQDLSEMSALDLFELFDAEHFVEAGGVNNLIEASNTASNTHYLQMCREFGFDTHPARFPRQIPEFFIQFLTPTPEYESEDDRPVVLDIFAGSNLTGKIAEQAKRSWLSFERDEEYVFTSEFRFRSEEEIRRKLDDAQMGLENFE